MKLPSVYTDMCFKQVFENATTDRNSPRRLVVNSASYESQLPATVPVPSHFRSSSVTIDAHFTEGLL
jgi:hypothetical protein